MDYTSDLYELCEMIMQETKEAKDKIRQAGGKLTGADTEYLDRLTHILKSLKTTIMIMEDEDGYSSDGGNYTGDSYGNGDSSYRNYPNGGSYARGRGTYAKRDSRGRYSSYGYSRHGDMAEELRRLMNEAPNDQIRMDIQRLADKVEKM